MKSSSILIEHQCPQCGAPAVLEETDHLFTCQFCRVKSFLLSGDFFRYMIPHAAPANKGLLFVPYWRFKGMHFSCPASGIKNRIVDVSHIGISSDIFPISLGLRSQTLKLRFVSPETEGRFLKPGASYREMMAMVEEWFAPSTSAPSFNQAFIGETVSQIYSPFYIDKKVYDAVLNRPVSDDLPEDSDIFSLPGGHPDWQIRFIAALCPACGWDLEGERDSLVLQCKNCDSVWHAGKEEFTKLKAAHLPGSSAKATFLPFYRIRADISGITLDSYVDLARIANLPRVVQKDWEDMKFCFWSPAFKIRPQDFLRFARNLTLCQPQRDFLPGAPKAPLYPVTLPIREVSEGLKINLASFVKPPETMLPRLSEITIKPISALLVYLPFYGEQNELSQPDFQLCINKNLLRFAKHL